VSCGNNNGGPSKSDLFAKATKYLDAKMNKDSEDMEVKFLELDTIKPLSTRDIQRVKMQPLNNEYKKEAKLYRKYDEIDKSVGRKSGKLTVIQGKKVISLIDSIDRWNARNEKLNESDTVGYLTMIKVEAENKKSGAKEKGFSVGVCFDSDYDVDAGLNKYVYGK
jgi:hypothetical protein